MLKSAIASLIAAYALLSQMKVEFYDKLYDVDLLEEYDFIVVGSGSSGSIVASRLTEIENVTVLLLEAGNSGRGSANVDVPYFTHKMLKTDNDWNYETEPLIHANSQRVPYPRGKIGGGTGTFNYVDYIRGSKENYDSWKALGAKGWGFVEVQKYFQKIEKASESHLDPSVGKNGKVPLSRGYYNKHLYSLFAGVANELGIPVTDYFQNGGITQGLSKFTSNVLKGIRQSSASVYLWPEWEKSKNRFHMAFKANVQKVLLKEVGLENQAYGVEFERKGQIQRISARKEIVISGGVFNTPKLLMLSGIGPKDHLDNLDIQVKVDLPGVGSNLQDHPYVMLEYYGEGLPDNITTTNNEILETFPQFLIHGDTTLSKAIPSAGTILWNTNYRNSTLPHSNVQLIFAGIQSNAKNLPKIYMKEIIKARQHRNGILNHFLIAMALSQPKSKGTVTLSSKDPKEKPIINLNFLSDPVDIDGFISGFRLLEEMEKTTVFKENQIKLVLQPYCNVSENNILPRSSSFYKCLTKAKINMFCHACCTSKMGPKSDRYAVVDPRLRVHGVIGLRIADASVMPNIVTANPQATCFMIAEKAAEMIKEDWNL